MCEVAPNRPDGGYGLENLPDGWKNARVYFRRHDDSIETRFEIINLESGKRYLHEPLLVISYKCLGLFLLVNPLYFLFYTIVQLARIPLVPILNISISAVFKEIWHLVKIPFFLVGMQFAALYGIFSPLEGRTYFATLESDLHDGKTRNEALQKVKGKLSFGSVFYGALSEETPSKAIFIGFCMQPLGTCLDRHIDQIEYQKGGVLNESSAPLGSFNPDRFEADQI